jgi:hypothetical protein
MIRNHKNRPRRRYILKATVTQSIDERGCQIDETAQVLIPNAGWQGTLGHEKAS